MRIVLPVLLASVLGSPLLFGNETPAPDEAAADESAPVETFSFDDWDRDFYICQAFDGDGFMVAMQMARDEALARVKTWEICYRNKLDCWLVQCYEQF